MSSSPATSITKVMSDPSCSAKGTTRSFMRSMCANASSAPSRCMACAIPQRMERSVARPTISARLPARKPIVLPLLSTRIDVHHDPPAGFYLMTLVQAVPALKLRDRYLKLARNAVHRVAASYRIEHAASGSYALVAKAASARLDDQSLTLHEGILSAQIIQSRQRAHRHAVPARDGIQRLARTHPIDDLMLAAA